MQFAEFQTVLAMAGLAAGLLLATFGWLLHRLHSHQRQHRALTRQLQEVNQRYQALQREHVRLQAGSEEREKQYRAQVGLLNEHRAQLKQEFEHLAHRIFENRSEQFSRQSQQSLETLLKPFREQISGFQQRIDQVHTESVKGQASLEGELRKVLEVGLQMNEQAGNLSAALKGDKKLSGNWGEFQLERSLQLAGLEAGDHYQAQAALRDENGRRRLPDFVVMLPDGKHLIIDSKVSLVDYERAVAADGETERDSALAAHALAVRRHIDDLASKDYAQLPQLDSPDFVLMFMPVEPAYMEALRHNRDLFNYGYERGVVLVSHTTLMPLLRTIANLWMVERSNREAREIGRRAGEIYNQVCLVAERLHRLGNTLRSAGNHYNDTVRALVGKQGLQGKVERFGQLSGKARRQMTEVTPIHADLEQDRLRDADTAPPAQQPLAGSDKLTNT